MVAKNQNSNPAANGWHSMNEIHKMQGGVSGISRYYEILKALEIVAVEEKSEGQMTQEIKTKLAILGHKNNFRVYTHQLDKGHLQQVIRELNNTEVKKMYVPFANTEWMFDLMWYRDYQDEEDGVRPLVEGKEFLMKCLNLVMECEWGGVKQKRNKEMPKSTDIYGEVKYDFQKLAIVNADKRLMICKQKRGDKRLLKLKEYIKDQVNLLKMRGDVLCVAYDFDFKSFRYQLFKKTIINQIYK